MHFVFHLVMVCPLTPTMVQFSEWSQDIVYYYYTFSEDIVYYYYTSSDFLNNTSNFQLKYSLIFFVSCHELYPCILNTSSVLELH